MTEFPAPSGHPRLSAAAEEAVETACTRQLELVRHRLGYESHATLEDCRAALDDWQVDECLILDLDLDERLTLLEELAEEYDLELGPVTLADLRSRIETLTATIVGHLGDQQARDAFQQLEDLLEEKDLPFEALLADNPYEQFRHYAERSEPPWHVYEYRNLDDAGINIDLYEITIAGISFYVRQRLEDGQLTPGDTPWAAT